jgi:ferredoxin
MAETRVIDLDGLQALLEALQARGRRLVGPTLRDGAIMHDDIRSIDDLPRGWTTEQEAGRARLARRDDDALFGYAVGADSWKRHLHPPRRRLWRAEERDGETRIEPEPAPQERFAFIGARACDLQAMAVQDRVFLDGPHVDPHYAALRRNSFIVAVNCGTAGGACFCASMGTGPRASAGHDLALTEILEGEHRFLVEAAGAEGAEILAALPGRRATAADEAAAEAAVARAAAAMGRSLETDGLAELLRRNPEHPRWDEVAARCLTCANCTMVCPTCFCTTVEDASDLSGDATERSQRWDSCFTLDFTHLHGGGVRSSARSRYRQWLTHKLSTWHDQFGLSGCVGCGRCIVWCPVGIDITEEAAAIRAGDGAGEGAA